MRGRPPKKAMSPEQERAALAFVDAAERPDSGSGRSAPAEEAQPAAPASAAPGPQAAPVRRSQPSGGVQAGEMPWEADYVREDVMKGYALRLPEPLYLRLKWVAEQTGRSINTVCREAVEVEVERVLQMPAAGGAGEGVR